MNRESKKANYGGFCATLRQIRANAKLKSELCYTGHYTFEQHNTLQIKSILHGKKKQFQIEYQNSQ